MIEISLPHETVPTGFVRLLEDNEAICDVPIPELERMLRRGDLYEDCEDGYQLTWQARAHLARRFRH